MLRLGVDAGETNTDAALLDDGRAGSSSVLAVAKTRTTEDVSSGMLRAIGMLPAGAARQAAAVMLGTTHFSNALRRASDLQPTAVIRFGPPSTRSLPPFVDWPEQLVGLLGGHGYLCPGGHEFDGRAVAGFDTGRLRELVARAVSDGARAIAVSAVFSPIDPEFETRAADVIAEEAPGVQVSLSHEIGRVGLLGRENATALNAALMAYADEVVTGLERRLRDAGVAAPLYLSQNDGTLMDIDYARRYPVATLGTGAANSMRGAGFLTGLDSCTVIDVGGTSTDVGLLDGGFPSEVPHDVTVAGVRTNFRMPGVLSIGVGGETTGDTQGSDAQDYLARRCADAVQRVRSGSEALPVVVVGGAGHLVPDTMVGVPTVTRPPHAAVANAIGAAVAKVGGEVDRVVSLDSQLRAHTLAEARREAVDRAVAAGARPGSVSVVAAEEIPMTYQPGRATRIRVKAVGDLSVGGRDA